MNNISILNNYIFRLARKIQRKSIASVMNAQNAINLILIIIFSLFLHLKAAADDRLRDPTQPQSSQPQLYKDIVTSQSNSEIEIDGIFANKDRNVVIVGNNIFTVGDKILDSTIIAIDPHSIKLKNENGEFPVVMPYSNVKSPIIKNKKDARENLE